MRQFTIGFALLLMIGGCGATAKDNPGVASAGSPGGSAAPPTTTTQQGSIDEQLQKFAKCMRDNGVDVPDPGPDGFPSDQGTKIDRESPAYKKAMEACKSDLPGGGDLSKLDPKLIDEVRELTKCLRANGIDIPDPDPNSPMLGLDKMNIDRNNTALQKAMMACQDKMPQRGGK